MRCRVVKVDDVLESHGIKIGDIVQYIDEVGAFTDKKIVAIHKGRKCVFMNDELEYIRD